MKKFILSTTVFLSFILCGETYATVWSFNSEAQFSGYSGATTAEGFDTIPINSWIYHTRLPGYIPAFDTDDDPADPDDGPDYDLDGHFDITGNSIAYRPADELFIIYDDGPSDNYLNFSPWYNSLWPQTYDPNNEHPIITIDNFNNNNELINAFSLWIYTGSSADWLTFDFGTAGYVDFSTGEFTTGQWNYFSFVSDISFSQMQLHTNQNGSSISIDSLNFGASAVFPFFDIPEPAAILLLGIGLLGLAGIRRKKF